MAKKIGHFVIQVFYEMSFSMDKKYYFFCYLGTIAHYYALLRIIPQKFVALLLHLGYFVALNEVKSSINQLHFINLRVLFFSQSFHRFSRYIGQHPSHYHIVQSVHPGTLSR